jgi:hypothetical protein
MNCCNDAGQCTQGEGCAIRRANESPFIREHTARRYREPAQVPPPIQQAEPPEDLTRLDWVLIALFVACITFFLSATLWGFV